MDNYVTLDALTGCYALYVFDFDRDGVVHLVGDSPVGDISVTCRIGDDGSIVDLGANGRVISPVLFPSGELGREIVGRLLDGEWLVRVGPVTGRSEGAREGTQRR